MISVIICTYNRSAVLKAMLSSLARMTLPTGFSWEVIVVDNNSTDDTKSVVEAFAESSQLDVRYVFEVNQGQSFARNAGMREARGEIVAFADDDVIVDQKWLAHIAQECSQFPSVAMYFGQTRLARPSLARIAIKEGDSPTTYVFPCSPISPGSGNNMVLRKSLLSSVGEFDTTLGPGSRLQSADDIDFTYRVLCSGGIVRYCPSILAYHDHDRLTPAKVRSLLFGYAVGIGAFYCKHALRRDVWALKLCYWENKSYLRTLFRKGEVIPVFLQFVGTLVGFWRRLAIEVER